MNGIAEDLQEHDELVDCGGVWMVGQVDVLVEQACDVGIPNGFHVPRRTCKASLGRRDAVDQHKCRNSFEVLNLDLAIEECDGAGRRVVRCHCKLGAKRTEDEPI